MAKNTTDSTIYVIIAIAASCFFALLTGGFNIIFDTIDII
jgi:hypothetical protein